ncbi:MAG: CopD family protein [Rhodospirillaceae bacterium]
MSLLFDILAYLGVLVDGLAMITQAMTLGGIAFLIFLAQPHEMALGALGSAIIQRTRRILVWSAMGLALMVATRALLLSNVLAGTAGMTLAATLGATFVRSGVVIVVAALLTVGVVLSRLDQHRPLLLPLAVCMILGAVSQLTHGAARLDDRWPLMMMMIVHLAAAATWIGGLPYFLAAMAKARDDHVAGHRIGSRFSLMAMISVFALAGSGIGMGLTYIDSVEAITGTAYGATLFTKVLLFLGILGFGLRNMLIVHNLRRSPHAPALALRRYAEVELGIGVAIFLTAASMTSLPPAVDLQHDRVTLTELAGRLAPSFPQLVSPEHSTLAIPQLEAKRLAAADSAYLPTAYVPTAYVPGAGVTVPPTAGDIAWSEYNHHWAGIILMVIGLCALLARTGTVAMARHWPLLFVGLALFVIIRSDPEAWPLGSFGFWETLRDPGVALNRICALLPLIFGLCEWLVQIGILKSPRAALVFPLLVAAGGTIMLTHAHSLGNLRQELLIEWNYIPIAVLGIASGWARWLELRLPPPRGRPYGWLWPVLFIAIGAILLNYREV